MAKIEVKEHNFWIDGRPTFLYGGTMQYYRIPKDLWRSSLHKLKDANINFIDIYIPWVWHEYEEGKFDFTGTTAPERDVVGFVQMAKETGLWVIARPGPNIYAEYTNFGFPVWLTTNYPEIMQVAEDGTKWHVISFNHPKHLECVNKWYVALFDALKPYFDSTIIGVQIDNETGYLLTDSLIAPTPLFRDYNESTMKMFLSWLEKKYGSVGNLNKLLSSNYGSFADFIPRPKLKWYKLRSDVKNFGEIILWQDFIEDWIVEYLKNLKVMMDKWGVKVPYLINEGAVIYCPLNTRKKSALAPVGYDLYPKSVSGDTTFDMPFLTCYAAKLFRNYAGDGPVYSPETGSGWFYQQVKVPMEETVQMIMMELAHSTRFINYYVLHDCIETDGTPYFWDTCINIKGEIQPRYDVIKNLGKFIRDNEETLLHSEEVNDELAMAEYLPNHRMFSSDPFYHLMDLAANGMIGLLHEVGVNPDVVDMESVSEEELRKYKAVLTLSKGFADADTWQKLKNYVKGGGTLVVYPMAIKKDVYGQPLSGADELFPVELKKRKIYYFVRSCLAFLMGLVEWRALHRWKIKSKWQLFTIDPQQQTMPGLKNFLGRKVRMKYPDGEVDGAPIVFFWDAKSDVGKVLTKGNKLVGFSKNYGKGKVICLGTIIGAPLSCAVYYKLKKKDTAMNRAFTEFILKECGVSKNISTSANIEITARKTDKGTMLFLLNRGDAKKGTFWILRPEKLGLGPTPTGGKYKIKTLFSYHKSTLDKTDVSAEELKKGIAYSMEKDDALVVEIG